jgi:hypothetical protein
VSHARTHDRGWRAWRLVMPLALLLAGSFLPVEVLEPDGSTPEGSSADQPVAEGVQQTGTSRLLRLKSWASTSPDAALPPLTQRSLGEAARIDRYGLAASRPPRHARFLPQAHLIHQSARTDSSTADPA